MFFVFTDELLSVFPVVRHLRMIVNGNYRYQGALEITSVPKGAVFAITISDQPNPRAMAA